MDLPGQTDQSMPTVFQKCWASSNDGVNVKKYWKGRRSAGKVTART